MYGLDWVQVDPGSAMLGSNDRSILRGGTGPRHQVKISKSFEITNHLKLLSILYPPRLQRR